MISGVLLDTHSWVWLQNDQLDMRGAVRQTLQDALDRDALFACSISMLEIANAARRGRMSFDRSLADWFKISQRNPGVRLIDISPEIALDTMKLPSAFHGDPGDRIIAATARVNGLTLCTHDRDLLRFGKQGLMRTLKVNKKRELHA
jgi:PIN domain nuclease of toxin-antitoxin system